MLTLYCILCHSMLLWAFVSTHIMRFWSQTSATDRNWYTLSELADVCGHFTTFHHHELFFWTAQQLWGWIKCTSNNTNPVHTAQRHPLIRQRAYLQLQLQQKKIDSCVCNIIHVKSVGSFYTLTHASHSVSNNCAIHLSSLDSQTGVTTSVNSSGLQRFP